MLLLIGGYKWNGQWVENFASALSFNKIKYKILYYRIDSENYFLKNIQVLLSTKPVSRIFNIIIIINILLKVIIFKIDKIFILKGESLDYNLLLKVKKIFKIKIYVWWVDSLFFKNNSIINNLSVFDSIFVYDSSDKDDLNKLGYENSVLFQCAISNSLYQIKTNKYQTKNYEVVFIGSYFDSRGELFKFLWDKGINLKVFGPGYKEFIKKNRKYRKHITNKNVKLSKSLEIYLRSKIVLNLIHPQSRFDGFNMKFLEILASSSIQIVNKLKGFDKNYEFENVYYFLNKEEILSLIKNIHTYKYNSNEKKFLLENTYNSRVIYLINNSYI